MKIIALLLAVGLTSRVCAMTFDQTMAATLERNPTIQAARSNLEAAAGRKIVLHAIAYPDARLDLFGGAQGGHRAGEPPIEPFGFVRGAFIQPLFNTRVPASWRRGNIEVLIAEQQLNLAIIEQLQSARVAFYTALYNRSLADLGEAQRQRLAGNAAGESSRYQAGQTTREAFNSARALQDELTPRIAEARRVSSTALLTLAQTTATQNATADGELQARDINFSLQNETKEALARRADLQLARLLVRAAAEDQRIMQAGYFPTINAIANGTYIPVSDVRRNSGGSPQRSNDVISSEVRIGAGFTWRVIDNGKVTGAVMRQRAIREMNELTLHQLEADVPRELERISNTLRSVEARRKAVGSAAAAAEQNVTAIQQNLAAGINSELDFRTAETSLLQTKTTLLTAAFEQNIALADWDRATGRYFQFADETTEH
ncbi:MAG: TolC family protein [Chthoniobacterales bacterium]